MPINIALVRKLLLVIGASTAVLMVVLVAALAGHPNLVAPFLIVTASLVLFLALLWLWTHWLLHFRRSGQKREFRLCYFLPYGYAFYRSMALVRSQSANGA